MKKHLTTSGAVLVFLTLWAAPGEVKPEPSSTQQTKTTRATPLDR